MNLFDIAIIVVLGYCVIRGIFRGFIKEVAAIVAILAGFYAAYMYHGAVSPSLSQWIADPDYRLLAAFALVFIGVFFFVTLVGVLIRMLARAAALGVVDRIFGAVFGAVKAVLLVTLIYILLVTFTPAGGMTFIRGSKLAPPVVAAGQAIVDIMPDGVTKAYDRKIGEFKKGWGRKS
jgi:membrane protein required for colicin V production